MVAADDTSSVSPQVIATKRSCFRAASHFQEYALDCIAVGCRSRLWPEVAVPDRRRRAHTSTIMDAVNPSRWMVPGKPLAAWTGPDGSSLVIYRTLWVPDGSAKMLAEAIGNRLENLPGLRLLDKRTETIAGVPAGAALR